ncbi:hypothetical protein [Halococcus salifodinae]|uniref:Conjugation protein n=1 Tax=Halococcus salifodinae DSM 8989 TaxID=1227456 RepID=M0MST1_9EURY|nr:hypothetical protein [Halococcus salifodinae]EMA47809.1 conjugation protein [Halococcus salifodinae DSM 8989]
MKQNPRDLINSIHERVADAGTEQKILAGYTEDPTLWGIDKKWLILMLLPAMLGFRVSIDHLSGSDQLYGIAGSFALAGLMLLATFAAPDDLEPRSYLSAVLSKHLHQREMIHDSNPDESRLEQPKNDALLARFTRLPVVRDWLALLGALVEDIDVFDWEGYAPTQALVEHEKPIRGKSAIKRDDGGYMAGMEIEAIPLRLESDGARRKAERAVANAFEGTVDYRAQWVSPTRTADYAHRRSQWKDSAQAYQAEADRLMSGSGEEAMTKAVRKQILADIADERAAGINLNEKTNRIQEHYLIVSIVPGEAVIDQSSETGGLGSITGFGWFVKKYRLWKHDGSDTHAATLIRKLERRTDQLETQLNRIDGLTPNTLPAEEFSEVIADYYRGTNVRAHDEFTDAIRGSPVPGREEAGDPEHDVGYHHIANRDRAGSPPVSTPSSGASIHATADGGAVSMNETSEMHEADAPASDQQSESDTQ